MPNERLKARRLLNAARVDELAGLAAGWMDGHGAALTPAAAAAARRIATVAPLVATYARIFPTLEGGLQYEFDGYPITAEVQVHPDGALAVTRDVDGVDVGASLDRLVSDIKRARSFTASSAQTLVWYDGPVVQRIMHGAHEIITMAVEDDRHMAIGILIDGQAKIDLEAGVRDVRDVMLDPRTILFSVGHDADGWVGIELLDEIGENCLPAATLFLPDMTENPYEDAAP